MKKIDQTILDFWTQEEIKTLAILKQQEKATKKQMYDIKNRINARYKRSKVKK